MEDKLAYEYMEEPEIEGLSLTLEELMESDNIVDLLGEEQVEKIGQICSEGYEIDVRSLGDRVDKMKLAQSLAIGCPEFKEKDEPWEGASNVVYPLITKAGISFAERAFPAIVRDDKVVDAQVIGHDEGVPVVGLDGEPLLNAQQQPDWLKKPKAKEQRGRRVSDFINYQFSSSILGWKDDTDKLLHTLPITGNMYRKLWWDSEEEQIRSCLVYPSQLIINAKAESVKRAIRISEEIAFFPYEVTELIRSGLWVDGKYLQEDGGVQEEESERLSDIITGTDRQAPHIFIEQSCRLDLDNDGYEEPYIVTFHKSSKIVVRIVANFQKDKIRKKKVKKKEIIVSIEPETVYIHYPFIPAPDGSMHATGFGELLLPTSAVINSLINQLIDAGKLSNTSTGLIGRGMRMKGGTLKIKMGEYNLVDSFGGAIRDNVYEMQFKEPSQVLFQLLGLMIDCGKDLAGLRDVLEGEQVANQAGITAMALIEQGLTQFKAIHKRVSNSINEEIQVIYRLNKLYLTDKDYADVLDLPETPTTEDFNSKDFNIVPLVNSHLINDSQRLARLQYLDTLRGDPNIDQEGLRREIFKLGGMDKLMDLVVPSPPPQEDPNIALQKSLIEVERMKTQVSQQKLMAENQIATIQSQMKIGEATHKAAMAEREVESKQAEQNANFTIKSQELQLKALESRGKEVKTNAEIMKIKAETDKIITETAEIGKEEDKDD